MTEKRTLFGGIHVAVQESSPTHCFEYMLNNLAVHEYTSPVGGHTIRKRKTFAQKSHRIAQALQFCGLAALHLWSWCFAALGCLVHFEWALESNSRGWEDDLDAHLEKKSSG